MGLPTSKETRECGCVYTITAGTDGESLIQPCEQHQFHPRLTKEQLEKLIDIIRRA